jgi:hypothetical protein
MKKLLFSSTLLLGLAAAPRAHAQLGMLVRTAANAHTLATRPSAAERAAAKDQENGLTTSTYAGKQFQMQRTPATKLPKKGAEQITDLETQLERCHTALVAGPTGALCTPEQRTALQQALVAVARTGKAPNMPAYQEEAAFYLSEDARRQQPAAPAN